MLFRSPPAPLKGGNVKRISLKGGNVKRISIKGGNVKRISIKGGFYYVIFYSRDITSFLLVIWLIFLSGSRTILADPRLTSSGILIMTSVWRGIRSDGASTGGTIALPILFPCRSSTTISVSGELTAPRLCTRTVISFFKTFTSSLPIPGS